MGDIKRRGKLRHSNFTSMIFCVVQVAIVLAEQLRDALPIEIDEKLAVDVSETHFNGKLSSYDHIGVRQKY
ncbi:hypothetical protein AB6A40_008112 [Gnathostoma spinigerum]|uniref:Uncharacterized protein n=1 Tax=Gnathostoma spinigerum TaxID=75299 RepID=A0ABD6EWG9_9BILA